MIVVLMCLLVSFAIFGGYSIGYDDGRDDVYQEATEKGYMIQTADNYFFWKCDLGKFVKEEKK